MEKAGVSRAVPALRQQSQYRRQLLLLAGGVAGAVVGALQAVFTRQVWLGAAIAGRGTLIGFQQNAKLFRGAAAALTELVGHLDDDPAPLISQIRALFPDRT
jgi:hypothetical protein